MCKNCLEGWVKAARETPHEELAEQTGLILLEFQELTKRSEKLEAIARILMHRLDLTTTVLSPLEIQEHYGAVQGDGGVVWGDPGPEGITLSLKEPLPQEHTIVGMLRSLGIIPDGMDAKVAFVYPEGIQFMGQPQEEVPGVPPGFPGKASEGEQ